jgi:hypothetical protein
MGQFATLLNSTFFFYIVAAFLPTTICLAHCHVAASIVSEKTVVSGRVCKAPLLSNANTFSQGKIYFPFDAAGDQCQLGKIINQ